MKITKEFNRNYFKKQTGLRKRTYKTPTAFYEDLRKLVEAGWGNASLLLVAAANNDKDPQIGTADFVRLKDINADHLKSLLHRLKVDESGRFEALVWLYFDGVNTFCLRPSAVVHYKDPLDFFAWVAEATLTEPRQAFLRCGKRNKYLRNVTLQDCEAWASKNEEIIV